MTSAQESSRRVSDLPVDFATADRLGYPIAGARWPVSLTDQWTGVRNFVGGYLQAVSEIGDEAARDALTLVYGRLTANTYLFADAALAIDALARRGDGSTLIGAPAWLTYLLGRDDALAEVEGDRSGLMNTKVPWPERRRFARRVKRSLGLNPPLRLPRAFLAPDAVAISTNALLQDHARHCGKAVGFRSATEWIGPIHADRSIMRTDAIDAAARVAGVRMAGSLGLSAELEARLATLIERIALDFMSWAAGDLAALRTVGSLPDPLLSGTGNNWSVRAVAIEARRRGGTLTSFAHGRGHGTPALPEVLAGNELLVSDRFVFVTEAMARMARDSGVLDLLPNGQRPELAGHFKPTTVAWAEQPRQASAGRRRVLYPGFVTKGGFARLPAPLPDLIYLNWQFDLVRGLKKLPVELICRPHPEGYYEGVRHPLSRETEVRAERFEELAPAADVILCDTPSSTTFFEALVSDRAVVLMDIYRDFFVPEFRRAIERRCRVVEVRFDDDNRPIVDQEALSEAICGGSDRADPSEMRALLLG